MSSEASSPDFLISKHGAVMHPIERHVFDDNERHALTAPRLQPDVIYRAHATSRQLEEAEQALAFEVVLTRIHKIEGHLAGTGFNLILLNEDYRHLSTHHAELWTDGRFHIPAPNEPIYVCRGNKYGLFDKVKTGYLLENDDSTLEDMINTPAYEDTPLFNGLTQETGQQRPHPLYPTDRE